jgi:Fungal specific transcription factor domain
MDLNSDGETLELSPFETDIRRRLWWGLVVLDIQGAEDRGMPQLIYSFQHDVQFPANINDEDIDPELGFIRGERSGFTIMTFSMITFEISKTYEYISCSEPKNTQGGRGYRVPSVEEKERKVNEVNNILHERYIKHINPDVLLEKKASLIAQTSILKQWLLLQYPISSRGKAIMPRSLATKDQILSSAVSLLEIQYQIEHMGQVSWVSKVWIQWHPLAVVLAELCVRTSGPLVARAWAIVDAVFDDWSEKVADTKNGALWRPIRKLMEQARRVHRRPSPRKSASASASASASPDTRNWSRSSSAQPSQPPQPARNMDGLVGSAGAGLAGVSPGPIAGAVTAAPAPMNPPMQTTFALFDPSMPAFSELHQSTIAMALDPNPPAAIPGMGAYAGMSVLEMNQMGANDAGMMGMNWEDWDTFFEANGLDVGYR